MRTRDRAYAASAAAPTTTTIVPAASSTELTRDRTAYGLRPISPKLPSVIRDGTCTPYVGVASNGADSSHSSGSAKNPVHTATTTYVRIRPITFRVTVMPPSGPRPGRPAGTPAPAAG